MANFSVVFSNCHFCHGEIKNRFKQKLFAVRLTTMRAQTQNSKQTPAIQFARIAVLAMIGGVA
jgi:hypothetical protein